MSYNAKAKNWESKWFKTKKSSINFCKKRKGGTVYVFSPFISSPTSSFEV